MGKFYLVFIFIGNLKDMIFRVIEVLKEVDVIFVEDICISGKFLKYFDIVMFM